MKIYIACPISKYVRVGFPQDFVEMMDEIYKTCKSFTNNVYFPLQEEAFGSDKTKGSGEFCTPKDFQMVTGADVIVAVPEISMGVSAEIGWASSAKKHVFVVIDSNYHQSEIIRFIDTITPTKKIYINSADGYHASIHTVVESLKDYLAQLINEGKI